MEDYSKFYFTLGPDFLSGFWVFLGRNPFPCFIIDYNVLILSVFCNTMQ